MDRERLDHWCEKGILGLVLSILVFGPLSAGGVKPFEFLVLQTLTVGVIALWMVRIWIRPNYRLLWPPICWVVLAFVGYVIVRYQFADIEYVARNEMIRVIIYAFLFFVILDNLHRQESAQTITLVLIFLAMVIASYAVFQFVTKTDYVWHLLSAEIKPYQYARRAGGTYICPNHLAGFLEMILPIGLAYTLTGRFKHTTKVFVGYASLVMLAGLAVTLSRGGWLASGLALALFFGILLSSRTNRLPAAVFLILVLAGGYYFFNHAYQRWQQMYHESGVVDDIRFYLWAPAAQIWHDHFWWGAGPGHFDYRFPLYRPEVVQMRPGYAHNDYLNTLADYGLVGTTLVALAFVLLTANSLKTWKFVRRAGDFISKPSSRASFVLGAGIAVLAILLHSTTDFNFHIPANAMIAVSLMALLTGYVRFATESHWVPASWLIRGLFTILGALGIYYLSVQGWKRLGEERLLARVDTIQWEVQKQTRAYAKVLEAPEVDVAQFTELGTAIQKGREQEIELLRDAARLEPMNFETTYKLGLALSWKGQQGHPKAIEEAIGWFKKGIQLNPYDAYNHLRAGMCLDWLGRHSEARPFFYRGLELDPNSFYMVAHVGVHHFYTGEFAEAKKWFEKSRKLSSWRSNHIAEWHLTEIAKREQANVRKD